MNTSKKTTMNSRRHFLSGGLAAGIGLVGATHARGSSFLLKAPTLSAGDLAILRFAAAAELIGADIWDQVAAQVRGNAEYCSAFQEIYPMLPDSLVDGARNEQSHATALSALLQDFGAPAIGIEGFQKTDRRLTKLTDLNIDVSYFARYDTTPDPDSVSPAASGAVFQGFSAIPTGLLRCRLEAMRLAETALVQLIVAEESAIDAYIALSTKITDSSLSRQLGAIVIARATHYATVKSSLACMLGAAAESGEIGSSLGAFAQNVVTAEGPPASWRREVAEQSTVAAFEELVRTNMFAEQPPEFFAVMHSVATAADAAVLASLHT
jgi:rubrerythrin